MGAVARLFVTPVALVALAGGVALALTGVIRSGRWVALGYPLVVVGATLFGDDASAAFVLAVVLLGLAGATYDSGRTLLGLSALLAVAVFMAFGTGLTNRPLFQTSLSLFIVIGALLLAGLERSHPGLPAMLVPITAFGVFSTLPNAEDVVALVTALVVPWSIARVRQTIHFDTSSAVMLLGTIGWIVTSDGLARTGSIVGGLSSAGLLIVFPMLLAVGHRLPRLAPAADLSYRTLVLAHGVLVLMASRLAGLQEKSESALLVTVVTVLVVWALVLPWAKDAG